MARIGFLFSVLRRRLAGQDNNCPFCGSHGTSLVQRKKIFLELRRCEHCALMYRYPKDDLQNNVAFYQSAYEQDETTDLPSKDALARLLANNFRGTSLDFSEKIDLIKRIALVGRLLDYGCSWGYAVHQFRRAGFDAVGFEISAPRAEYGRTQLGVDIVDNFAALDNLPDAAFDVIYSSHVFEHLPDLKQPLATFRRLLKRSGIVVIFVPNAGGRKARELDVGWGPMIGEKHGLALDANFFARNLPTYGLAPKFGSTPYDSPLVDYESREQAARVLTGDELLVVAWPAPEDDV